MSQIILLRNSTVAASMLMTQSQNVQNAQARTFSSGNRNMSGTASNMNSVAALNSKKKVRCLCSGVLCSVSILWWCVCAVDLVSVRDWYCTAAE
jgi:hypothetical protein